MRAHSINVFIFLVILSSIGLSSCSSKEPESTPPEKLSNQFRFHADDFNYAEFNQSKEKFLQSLRARTYYDTPGFDSEKQKFTAKHYDIAEEYIVWRQKYGTYYEDYDFYRFIFQKIEEEDLSFPSYYEEHILAIAEAATEKNKDIVLFVPAFDKDEFEIRASCIRRGTEKLALPEFSTDYFRKSILDYQEKNQDKQWCVIGEVPSRIKIDENGNVTISESDTKHSIDFTQRIYGYEYEKEMIFELIAATGIGREFLPEFLNKVKDNEIKVAFEEFPGNPNKTTLTAGQWDSDNKKLSLNSGYFWTYGSMAAILFHEIIHTFPREKTTNILPEKIRPAITELENNIRLYTELLNVPGQREEERINNKKELNDNIKKLEFYDELMAYAYQYDFAQELYDLAPCTLLHLRIKDVQGLKDIREIKRRTESR